MIRPAEDDYVGDAAAAAAVATAATTAAADDDNGDDSVVSGVTASMTRMMTVIATDDSGGGPLSTQVVPLMVWEKTALDDLMGWFVPLCPCTLHKLVEKNIEWNQLKPYTNKIQQKIPHFFLDSCFMLACNYSIIIHPGDQVEAKKQLDAII